MIKTFEVLKGIQDNVVLDGTVYLDETYFTKVKSKLTTKNGKKLRKIARNKICLLYTSDAADDRFLV